MGRPDDAATPARQLAKDLLDEMDKPKSAEREADEARKDREDREALERFYLATGQVKPEPAHLAIAQLLEKIERMEPAETAFDPIEVPLTLAGRTAVLRWAQSPSKPDKRFIELSMWSESGLSTTSQWLESGSNSDLIAYLRGPDAVADTLAVAGELVVWQGRNGMA